MVRRKLTVGGLISYLASVSHFHCVCVCFCVVFFPHAISFWNMIPGSLLPLFNCVPIACVAGCYPCLEAVAISKAPSLS